MRTETCHWTGTSREMPETIVERIAWAICIADHKSGEGYLNDAELRALEAMLAKMGSVCGSEKAESQWLGVPVATVESSVRKLKLLARTERSRRTDYNRATMIGHLTAAFWTDYMDKAEAAWSVIIERPEAYAAQVDAAEPGEV